MSIIYGPVPSWRLGRSLGIDLLSTEGKTCTFDCIYCQLGKTVQPLAERREFVTLDKLATELGAVKGIAADYATFSGVGEPTLASNLGEAIGRARSVLQLPVAVLTNSSLMTREDVRRELASADVVVAKVDAPDEELFCRINRPIMDQTLDQILKALKLFRKQYQGRLALQLMFVEDNKDRAPELAQLTREISPDEVQLNTPLRPCPVKPLPPQKMSLIKQEFEGLETRVVMVYEAPKPEVTPIDLQELLRRRVKL